MTGVWPGLHLPGVSFANELVAHRHPGLGRLALRAKAHFGFARIALEFDANHLNIEVGQSEISARLHMAQHGSPDGFVIVDAGLLASGHQTEEECGKQKGKESFAVRHCYLKYIRLPCGLGAIAAENAWVRAGRRDGDGGAPGGAMEAAGRRDGSYGGAPGGATYSILSCLKRSRCDNLGEG